jgi:hypothetical protein
MLELILYLILGGLILAILLFALIGVAVVVEFYKSCRNGDELFNDEPE